MEYSIHSHTKMEPILLFNPAKRSLRRLMSSRVVQKVPSVSFSSVLYNTKKTTRRGSQTYSLF